MIRTTAIAVRAGMSSMSTADDARPDLPLDKTKDSKEEKEKKSASKAALCKRIRFELWAGAFEEGQDMRSSAPRGWRREARPVGRSLCPPSRRSPIAHTAEQAAEAGALGPRSAAPAAQVRQRSAALPRGFKNMGASLRPAHTAQRGWSVCVTPATPAFRDRQWTHFGRL